jgi:ATP-binding cassette subfamily A (ABC1) protein 3
VLLLDEPTTGQDAGAKRVFWKVLRSICTNRAILLTTHSMEETEALATKVTILATRVLASGSLSQLTNEHGGHYHIRGTYGPEQDENDIGRLLVSKFGDLMTGLTVKYGEAEFELPHRPRDLGKIMLAMEGLVIGAEERMTANGRSTAGAVEQRDLGRVFSSYVIIEPTMEEVFMKVCQKASLTAPIES